tara:strand:+ start:91 stop:552 length:462 start_codon:yes stop_codon:yes gene_type:complete
MSLRLKIEENYKNAIKNKKNNEINTLRLIKSAIKDKDIESRTNKNDEGISEPEIMSLLQNLIKQRKDSIDSFKQASRDDLIEIEQSEINIISEFLPKQKDLKETEILIDKIIKEQNYESIKDMGGLMKDLKTNYSGSIDMALAGKIAKSKFKI